MMQNIFIICYMHHIWGLARLPCFGSGVLLARYRLGVQCFPDTNRRFGVHRRRLAPALPDLQTCNGEQPPLIESLLQALNTFVDRLNQAEATVEPDRERKTLTDSSGSLKD
jgi:hypothetical protein